MLVYASASSSESLARLRGKQTRITNHGPRVFSIKTYFFGRSSGARPAACFVPLPGGAMPRSNRSEATAALLRASANALLDRDVARFLAHNCEKGPNHYLFEDSFLKKILLGRPTRALLVPTLSSVRPVYAHVQSAFGCRLC